MVNLGLLPEIAKHGTPRQKCPLVRRSPLGPEHVTWIVPPLQQPQSQLEKLGLMVLQSASTKPGLVESSSDAGPSWSRACGNSASLLRKLGLLELQRATTEPELAESPDEAGPSWSRANGKSAASAAVKSAGENRSSRIVKFSVTSEFDDGGVTAKERDVRGNAKGPGS